jgi:Protein of unknown function (DUF3631)
MMFERSGSLVMIRVSHRPQRSRSDIIVFDLLTLRDGDPVILGVDSIVLARQVDRTVFVETLAASAEQRAEVEHLLQEAALEVQADGDVSTAAESEETEGQGGMISFDEPEPSELPVDTATLLRQLCELFTRFAVLPEGAALTLALWTLLTYVVDAIYFLPKLVITSPTKRCGKTTVLSLLVHLVRRALAASNLTPAVVFRVVDQHRPSLIVDEADTLLQSHSELIGVLNSGHSRPTAFVIRNVPVGDGFEPRRFCTFSPQAFGLIGKLPNAALADRAIQIPMRRKGRGERVETLRLDRLAELAPLPSLCLRWAADYLEWVRQAEPVEVPELDDRARDNWRSLLAIADLAGPVWGAEARVAARTLSGATDDLAGGELLLADLRDLFADAGVDRMASAEIVAKLGSMEERKWATWIRDEKPITVNGVAQLLRPFGIHPGTIRLPDGSTPKGYTLKHLEPVFARYLISTPATAATAATAAGDNDLARKSAATTSRLVAAGKAGNSVPINDVAAVAAEEGTKSDNVGFLLERASWDAGIVRLLDPAGRELARVAGHPGHRHVRLALQALARVRAPELAEAVAVFLELNAA